MQFLQRTDELAVRLGCRLLDLPVKIGISERSMFGYRSGKNPVTAKALRKLEAAELAAGETVTGFLQQPGAQSSDSLAIFTRNTTLVLYGTSSSDWNLTTFNPEAGAIEWTMQYIYQGVYLDDRGITPMSTSTVAPTKRWRARWRMRSTLSG